ncbi:MAG: threonine--tRNA ligase [Bacteroidia bacterium]|nr:threonine--tRNA ligase [Bacteroidia bacterium]MCX7763825.1 threonine--tRNA ligase [Bacteroidia bacterium]MDW8056659.1 threonine--tRNA ligase [Bacteroidia bacterium]
MQRILHWAGQTFSSEASPEEPLYKVLERVGLPAGTEILTATTNGSIHELQAPVGDHVEFQLLGWDSPEGKYVFWHSSAHILAEAILSFFPKAKLSIGPPIENGFYYDIDFGDTPISPEDFERIEQKFLELAAQPEYFVRKKVSKEEALSYYQQRENPYKIELIQELPPDDITFYESGNFVDLCKGPHLWHSGPIRAVKILSLAGAYWRGDSRNPQLTRVYAISFPEKALLEEYLHFLEEAARRDHRNLGKQLDLFSFHEEGPGFPFWHPKGMRLLTALQDWMRAKLLRSGYEEIRTPIILTQRLWEQSGHYENYRENMYFTTIDEEPYAVKPMNCPGSTIIYRSRLRSYRELPLRLFEFGLVHRHELSGVLTGLFRVRAFTQDDAHIYCTPEQIEPEITALLQLVNEVYEAFGFSQREIYLSTRPEKYIGSLELWSQAESALEAALRKSGFTFQINPGEGAFYGPKIDFVVRDSLRRRWQLGTIQLDFSMPRRFGLEYIGPDGQPSTPVMIHRAILGSFERFIGVLLEHTAGELPLWLSPIQVKVLPVSEKFYAYADEVGKALAQAGIRWAVDKTDEKLGKKIREAEQEKVPLIWVVGAKEAESGTVSIRDRRTRTQSEGVPLAQAVQDVLQASQPPI